MRKTRYADVSASSGSGSARRGFGSREDVLIESRRQTTDLKLRAVDVAAGADLDPWDRVMMSILVATSVRRGVSLVLLVHVSSVREATALKPDTDW